MRRDKVEQLVRKAQARERELERIEREHPDLLGDPRVSETLRTLRRIYQVSGEILRGEIR